MSQRPHKSFLPLLLAISFVWTLFLAYVYYTFPVVSIIRAATLSSGLVLGLILLTSWAGRRGYNLGFLATLLFTCSAVILVFALIQLFFLPSRMTIPLTYGFTALLSCGLIVRFHSYLKWHSSSEESILLAIILFSFTVTLFFSLFYLIINLA